MADSDIQLTQILNGVVQLAKYRPQLAQLITSLFSGLDSYLSEGESRLAAGRRNVEQWFDDTMDRAGGWYKRSTQLRLGIVGLVLAILLNVDVISLTTALWRDPTLRQSVLEQAQKYQLTSGSDQATISSPEEAAQAIRNLNAELSQDWQLPIGWHSEVYQLKTGQSCVLLPQRVGDVWGIPSKSGCILVKDASPNQNIGLFGKLLGLILMAMAVSQGAPFWFDLLSKISNQRGTGPVPAPSVEKVKIKVEKSSGESA